MNIADLVDLISLQSSILGRYRIKEQMMSILLGGDGAVATVSLVIMAAGMGSRFGGGIKQLEPIGNNGEIIMDYSIHDAIEAGFDKMIFVIRKDIEEAFKAMIGNRIEEKCSQLGVEIAYAFQSIEAIPSDQTLPEGRTKPWGTGQAVLAAKELIHEPFAVINADDYYGKQAFRNLHEFLTGAHSEDEFCMAGFILKNTLSDNGGVTRGICSVSDGMLTDVVETSNITKTANGAEVNGTPVDPECYVSMNMWGLTPSFLDTLEVGFDTFFKTTVRENPLQAEYLLPIFIGQLLGKGRCSVKVLPTADRWFGITYKEDKDLVVDNFKRLIVDGVYRSDLYSDLMERK